jgi:hypothetical protein
MCTSCTPPLVCNCCTTSDAARYGGPVFKARTMRTPQVGMGDAENLRQAIRQRIETGALPCGHQRMWAGPGREHVCVVCGVAIPPTVNEYEVLFPGSDESVNSLYFHLGCLNAWLEECRDRDGRDESYGTA